MKSLLSLLAKLDRSNSTRQDRAFRYPSIFRSIDMSTKNKIRDIKLSRYTSLFTIIFGISIGVTYNPARSWAGSGCIGIYATSNGSPNSTVSYYNSVSKSYSPVLSYVGTDINAIATQPLTGNLFFVNRLTRKVVVFNPNTNVTTPLGGTLPAPASGTNIIGATFDNTGKFYVLYGKQVLIEVDTATGNQTTGTSNILISGTGGGINGDIAIGTDGFLYAVIDNTTATSSQLYKITIDTATSATATVVGTAANSISGTVVINGLAIDPNTNIHYVTTGGGTLYTLNPTTKVITTIPGTTGGNDLASCGLPPDGPTITKAFSPNIVTLPTASSTLTLTLSNTNAAPDYLLQSLTDTFPNNLKVSATNGLGGTCLNTATVTNRNALSSVTATPTTGSSITLASGFKIPAGGCTVTVNVTASGAGNYLNTIAAGHTSTGVTDPLPNAGLVTTAGTSTAATSATFTVIPTPVSVSGTVFNDANGGTINGTVTNAGSTTLTAYLVSTGTTPVTIAKATVGATGVYIFPTVAANNTYTIRLSNDATGALNVAPPTASLPINYVNTGEGVGVTPTTADATADGSTAITVGTVNLANVNFGIEQLPNTTDLTSSQVNPGGTNTVTVPTQLPYQHLQVQILKILPWVVAKASRLLNCQLMELYII